ncbi:hypothetical protein V3W47_19100 [Deinococcus sp. YIM 134068]|uniref:hypothetical protein n=1 Tax=Deinococcus lichenicola TaxID=3118910 RepID=UPI002F957D27
MNEDAHLPRLPRLPGEHEVSLPRVWHESDGTRAVWRASVLRGDSPRRHLATPDALLNFLAEHLRHGSAGNVPCAEF